MLTEDLSRFEDYLIQRPNVAAQLGSVRTSKESPWLVDWSVGGVPGEAIRGNKVIH